MTSGATGHLVEEQDVEGMAYQLLELAGDSRQRRRLGLQGQEFVRSHHDLERQNAVLQAL